MKFGTCALEARRADLDRAGEYVLGFYAGRQAIAPGVYAYPELMVSVRLGVTRSG